MLAVSSEAEAVSWINAFVVVHKHVRAVVKFMKQNISDCRKANPDMDRPQLHRLLRDQYKQLAPKEKDDWEKGAAIIQVKHLPMVDSKQQDDSQRPLSGQTAAATAGDDDGDGLVESDGEEQRADSDVNAQGSTPPPSDVPGPDFVRAFSQTSSRDVSAPTTSTGRARDQDIVSGHGLRTLTVPEHAEPDEVVEMHGPRHPSPVKMSKKFSQEEEMLGKQWLDKRAAEMVYLERCEEGRVLPLSTCLQSVIRPRALSSAGRFFGDTAGDQAVAQLSGGDGCLGKPSNNEHAQQTSNVQAGVEVGEGDEEEQVLISVRHYGMSSAALQALVSWIASRAGIRQLALGQEEPELESVVAESGADGGPSGIRALKANGTRQRVVMDFSGNGMRSHDSSALMSELGICLHLPTPPPSAELARCRITEIDLSRNDIGGHLPLLFEPARDKYPTLLRSHQLRRLNLSDVGLTDACGESIRLALLHNSTLTAMDVSKNRLASRSALALAELLGGGGGHGAVLTSLNMGWNAIDGNSQGGLALCATLGSSSVSLTSLDLSWNPVREKGAMALGEALRRNEAAGTLQDLNLAHAHVTEAAAVMLGCLLVSNSQLTALHMSGNPIGFHGARALCRLVIARPFFAAAARVHEQLCAGATVDSPDSNGRLHAQDF